MSPIIHYWLVAGQVITADASGKEFTKNMNALLTTDKFAFTRKDLAKAQQALQMRFVTSCEQVPGRKIIDVFMFSVSHMGPMAMEEFHEGFDMPAPAESVEKQGLN